MPAKSPSGIPEPKAGAQAERILGAHVDVAEILAYLQQTDCFLTKASAAKFIDHRDCRILEHAIRTGRLRAFRVGKKTLIRKAELVAWIEAGEITLTDRAQHKTEQQTRMDRAIEMAKAEVAARKAEP